MYKRIRLTMMHGVMLGAALHLTAACAESGDHPGVAPQRATQPDFFADVPRARITMLGVFHFQDAGLDSYRPQHHVDVRVPERQAEVQELILRLAEFQPTRIAVEQPPALQARLDSLYAEYRAGRWELGANEVFQLGFRLAAHLGHDRVYAVDAERHPFLLQFWRDHRDILVASSEQDRALGERYRALYSHDDSLKTTMTLREYLLHLNHPHRLRLSHGHNMIETFKADGDSGFVGADAALGWYSRNLRIFRNLQRITDGANDRILVIMGSGHLPTLQFYADASPEYELVDVREFLRGR